ncbi:hypothetical protein FPCIR_834 [Fusarium pseudocircinatum]|uniref:Uncharacterized protein n=1 Tax=Fusarium pseudocircinatum TaxID=56676 RepID=A0A8H5PX78_9HYPO|nr:hypothetical protein FPCIR_834 [Fusarium pseudocircinatum]
MASNETVLLEPFGAKPGTKWFRTAFKWNRNQIFEWLKTTADAGGAGPNNKVPVALLTDIYNRLISLSLPNGTLYQNPRLRPRSHIARKVDENWDPYNPETSKFAVKGWAIRPSIQASRAPVPEWWCPYDLLGLFLSLLGPAPATATKNNFYLPLTAVYGRWCSRIAGHPDYGWWTPTIQGEGASK